MLETIQDWLGEHQRLVTWLGIASLVTAIGSVVALPWLIVALPGDYFATERRTPSPLGRRHPTP